jgi:hypothetical protein
MPQGIIKDKEGHECSILGLVILETSFSIMGCIAVKFSSSKLK